MHVPSFRRVNSKVAAKISGLAGSVCFFTFKKRVSCQSTNTAIDAMDCLILHIYAAMLILWCVRCVSSQPINTSGPTNITRAEGDVDEFIPCPFDEQATSPFWVINGVVYHTTQLPYPFETSYNSTGIVIKLISRYLNGTMFQCYVASGSHNDPRPKRSSLGILTVTFDPQRDPPVSSGTGSVVIQLTHQHLHFTQDNVTLAWSLFDKDTGSDLSQPSFQYSLDISDCNPQNVSTNYSVNNKMVIVSSQELDSNSFINITLPSQSLSIDERFRIKQGGTLMLFRGHTDVPEPERGTFVAIPQSPTSDAPDALCLAVPLTNILDQCYDLQNQNQCGDYFSTSIFSNSIKLCGNSSGTRFKMCFTNTSVEMNITRIQFSYSQSPRCTATRSRVQSKLYIASYKMIIVKATKSSEVINRTTGEICFDIYSRSCSQYISYTGKSYGISIFDVTGYLTYMKVYVSPGSCLHTPARAHSVCAPFSIVVTTHNPQQNSHSQAHTVATGAAVNPCQCAFQNVHLQVYNETSEAGTSMLLRCNHMYITDVKLMVELQPVDSERPYKEIIVNCSRGYDTMIRDVQCSTIQVSMFLNDAISDTQCVLLKSNISTNCKTDLESTPINATRFALSLSIALPLVFVSLLVGLIVIIIALAVRIISRKNHHMTNNSKRTKTYDSVGLYNNYELTPQRSEDSRLKDGSNKLHLYNCLDNQPTKI